MFKALFRPDKTLGELVKARHPVRLAGLSVVGVGVLYGVTSAVLGATGAVPTAPVFFGLDVDNYYFWQMVFVLPLIAAVWVIASGILRIRGKRVKSGPGFGGTAALVGIIWSTLLLVAWVPTGIYAVFLALGMGQDEWVTILSARGPWQTSFLAWYAGAGALAVRDFILAAQLVRKKSWAGAVMAGLAAAAVAIGAFIAFIR
jgi:hypothetical protein